MKLIRKRFHLPDNLAALPKEQLLRMVVGGIPQSFISGQQRSRHRRWKTILQSLGAKVNPSPHTPSNVCQALCNWSKTGRDPADRVRELCDALCKVGHFSAIRELVLQGNKTWLNLFDSC